MKIDKSETETYLLKELKRLDPVTVYVTNYSPGRGRIVIECYGKAWANFWGGMGDMNLQAFFLSANNEYLLDKFIAQTDQIDFDSINKLADKKGISLSVSCDVDIEIYANEMEVIFGCDWRMELPQCSTHEYTYLNRIINSVKDGFMLETKQTDNV